MIRWKKRIMPTKLFSKIMHKEKRGYLSFSLFVS